MNLHRHISTVFIVPLFLFGCTQTNKETENVRLESDGITPLRIIKHYIVNNLQLCKTNHRTRINIPPQKADREKDRAFCKQIRSFINIMVRPLIKDNQYTKGVFRISDSITISDGTKFQLEIFIGADGKTDSQNIFGAEGASIKMDDSFNEKQHAIIFAFAGNGTNALNGKGGTGGDVDAIVGAHSLIIAAAGNGGESLGKGTDGGDGGDAQIRIDAQSEGSQAIACGGDGGSAKIKASSKNLDIRTVGGDGGNGGRDDGNGGDGGAANNRASEDFPEDVIRATGGNGGNARGQ